MFDSSFSLYERKTNWTCVFLSMVFYFFKSLVLTSQARNRILSWHVRHIPTCVWIKPFSLRAEACDFFFTFGNSILYYKFLWKLRFFYQLFEKEQCFLQWSYIFPQFNIHQLDIFGCPTSYHQNSFQGCQFLSHIQMTYYEYCISIQLLSSLLQNKKDFSSKNLPSTNRGKHIISKPSQIFLMLWLPVVGAKLIEG